MNERAQVSIEYILLMVAAISVAAIIVYVVMTSFQAQSATTQEGAGEVGDVLEDAIR